MEKLKQRDYHLENIGEREREKLINTAADAELLAGLIRNYLKLIDFCSEKGIAVKGRTDLSGIRSMGELADSCNGDIRQLQRLFERGQSEIIGNIPVEFKEEVESKMEK